MGKGQKCKEETERKGKKTTRRVSFAKCNSGIYESKEFQFAFLEFLGIYQYCAHHFGMQIKSVIYVCD